MAVLSILVLLVRELLTKVMLAVRVLLVTQVAVVAEQEQ